jgi:hypothetical protein
MPIKTYTTAWVASIVFAQQARAQDMGSSLPIVSELGLLRAHINHSIRCRLHRRSNRRADDLDVVLKGSGRLSTITLEDFVELGHQ